MTTIPHHHTRVDVTSMDLLRTMLEEAFVQHTNRLTEVTALRRMPSRGGYDAPMLDALDAHHRQGVAETAHALQRMADGSYGICRACGQPIALGRLRMTPEAENCSRCQPGDLGKLPSQAPRR